VANPSDDSCVVDLAASHHMIRDKRWFTAFTSEKIVIKTGNPDSPLTAIGHGTAKVVIGGKTMILHDCLLVPKISQQLISLVRLIKNSITIVKEGSKFEILDSSGLIFSGDIVDNLLHSHFGCRSTALVNYTTWHQRLGHPSRQVMKTMKLPVSDEGDICEVCICSKMTSSPFSSHFSPVSSPLHRLHMDLVGPITPPSVSGFKYFFTLVDQYSSFKFVRFLKSKSDALEEFKKFASLVENIQDSKIKEVVSDNGGEFISNDFKTFCEAAGILQIFSPPNTPEHNGFAERANRTILDKARSMLLTSRLPKQYWAEAINSACLISNMLATPSRSNHSPFELWTKSSAPIHRIRTFGCKAFINVPKDDRTWKLGTKGDIGILIGFENDGSTFRILRLRDRKLVRTRHARFDETSFPSLSDCQAFCNDDDKEIYFDSFDETSSVASENPALEEEQITDDPADASRPTLTVIGPRHPTIIRGDITTENILPYSRRRPQAFVTSVIQSTPSHYNQAIKGSDGSSWSAAIASELDSMKKLKVWEVVDLTPSMKTVGTTWVFRKKSDGDKVVFKARLCAQGFSQTHGVDFSKTFAPTGRLNSLRALISFAAANDLDFQQMDVKTAFLNADLEEEVYLSIPQGVSAEKKKKCLKLNKAIYGLKQAPLAWYNRLSSWLISVGFKISIADPCVFFRLGGNPVWLFVHVDDIAIFGKDLGSFKEEIAREFEMKDLGRADLLLGIKITHDPSAIVLSQRHYVHSLLELYGMTACRPVSTPLVPNSHLDKASIEEVDRFNSLGVNYRSAVGALSYLSSATRPDISYAVSTLSQFLESPGINHWEAFVHVLKYLSGTQEHSLIYARNTPLPLTGYTDADWGNCPVTRRSVTGYLSQFNGHLISWQTKKQPVVSLSSCEAEYRALTDFSCELLWIRQFLEEVGLLGQDGPTVVHEDNQGCIAVANFDANTNSKRMKHVEIQLHFIREVIKNSKIVLRYTPTIDMLADFLTKAVPRPALSKSLLSLGLFRLEGRGGVEI
jgi:transposase InsO family protein